MVTPESRVRPPDPRRRLWSGPQTRRTLIDAALAWFGLYRWRLGHFAVLRWWFEVDPLRVESFTQRMAVGADRCVWRRPGWFRFGSGLSDRVAGHVGEGHAAGDVGVAGDTEFALVVEPVVVRTQTDQVGGVGRAVVPPVDDVMHLEMVAGATTWHPAAGIVLSTASVAVNKGVAGSGPIWLE